MVLPDSKFGTFHINFFVNVGFPNNTQEIWLKICVEIVENIEISLHIACMLFGNITYSLVVYLSCINSAQNRAENSNSLATISHNDFFLNALTLCYGLVIQFRFLES